MPKFERVGYERLELFIPPSLLAAVQRAAGKNQSVTAWACAVLAKAAGVEYTAPKLGRPVKTKPDPPATRKPQKRRGK